MFYLVFVKLVGEMCAKVDVEKMKESQVTCLRAGRQTLGEEKSVGEGVCRQKRQEAPRLAGSEEEEAQM